MAEQHRVTCANCRGQKVVRIEDKRGRGGLMVCPVCKGEGHIRVVDVNEEDYRRAMEEQDEDRGHEP